MTRIVCALEQYRAKHRTYPAALEELTPIFLHTVPNDVIDAAPMRYRRGEGSGFLLYSIGGNRKDDGGSFVPEKGRGGRPRPADWVWGERWP
jgi:hypothetical protein